MKSLKKSTMATIQKTYGSNSITEGAIFPALISFFFPIFLGALFQQLYNTCDAIIVGRFVGKEALAAVGSSTAAFINLLVGFFMGLASGCGIVISQAVGAKNRGEISKSIHTTIILAVAGGIILTFFGYFFSHKILSLMKVPQEILALSELYLKVFFLGSIPMFVYNLGTGILRSVGDSKTPFYILVAACFTNIILDLVFIAVLKMGVFGAALATTLSQTESAFIVLLILFKPTKSIEEKGCKLSFRQLKFSSNISRRMFRISLPTAIQTSFYSLTHLIITSFINGFGTDIIAAWSAFGKCDQIFWMAVSSMGMALTTFSGQNYGAGKIDRVKKSTNISMLVTSVLTVFLAAIFISFENPIYSMFCKDPDVIAEGCKIMNFVAPLWICYISIEVLSGAIRGTGRTLIPTIISLIGVCAFRIIWLFTVVPHHKTIIMVIGSYPITWTITSISLWIYYFATFYTKKCLTYRG